LLKPLTSCWICGGPLGLRSWPWVSTPVHPSQLADNDSMIQNDSDGDKTPWFVTHPQEGQYCLSRNQLGRTWVGQSSCKWTFRLGCNGYSNCSDKFAQPLCGWYDVKGNLRNTTGSWGTTELSNGNCTFHQNKGYQGWWCPKAIISPFPKGQYFGNWSRNVSNANWTGLFSNGCISLKGPLYLWKLCL